MTIIHRSAKCLYGCIELGPVREGGSLRVLGRIVDREEAARRSTHSCDGCYRDGHNDALRDIELASPFTFRLRYPDWAVSEEDRLSCQRAAVNAVESLSARRRRAA